MIMILEKKSIIKPFVLQMEGHNSCGCGEKIQRFDKLNINGNHLMRTKLKYYDNFF